MLNRLLPAAQKICLRFWTFRGNPWCPLPLGDSSTALWHRRAVGSAFRRRFGGYAPLIHWLLTLTWPLRLTWQINSVLSRLGGPARAMGGPDLIRQAWCMAALGLKHGIAPLDYYALHLFLPAQLKAAPSYVFSHELEGLFAYLNAFSADQAVDDKRLFAERCRQAGLPCPPTLAWGERGRLQASACLDRAGDLVSKPICGSRGVGVDYWRAEAGDTYVNQAEIRVSAASLPTHLSLHSGAWLLQPALRNHAELANLSAFGLISLRIVTMRGRAGAYEPLFAVLKLPRGRRVTNNSGLAARVDLASGRLDRAYPYFPMHDGFETHPDTGGRLAGCVLPAWPEALALALRAHESFPDFFSLGWDIALTPTGPVLLEANAGWEVILPQRILGFGVMNILGFQALESSGSSHEDTRGLSIDM